VPKDRRYRSDAVVRDDSVSVTRLIIPLFVLIVLSGTLFFLILDGDSENPMEPAEQPQSEGGLTTADDTDGTSLRNVSESSEGEKRTVVQGGKEPELDRQKLEGMILRSVNRERAKRGLERVELSENLSDIARNHSRNMSESGYVAHVDPSGENVTRYRETCKGISRFGNLSYSENIARSWFGEKVVPPGGGEPSLVDSEKDVVENVVGGWIESDWHRENMLDDEWRTTGIGVVSNESGAAFATQSFCSRTELE
jgi:uncharacterized protein YkwD